MNTENTPTEVYVSEAHFEDRLIPKFFLSDWAKANGTNPLEDKYRYDNIVAVNEGRFILGIVITVIGIISLVPFTHGYLPSYASFPVVFGGLIIAGLSDMCNPPETCWYDFNASVKELFEAFHIVPDKEIGAMSREEFAQGIVEALKASAAVVDTKISFERVNYMNTWKAAHEIAFKHKLCAGSYDNFFPKKEK